MSDKRTNVAIKYKTTQETISNAINSSTSAVDVYILSVLITPQQVKSENN